MTTTTNTVAPVKTRKPRKARTVKLPTVIDNEPCVYGCELPDSSYIKLMTPSDEVVDKNGVGHVPMRPVIVEKNRQSMSGKSLWVHPNGTPYDAYDCVDPISGNRKHIQNCTGHSAWSAYFMHTSNCDLETQGWAHVSCGKIMMRRKMMSRRQQDTLEIWAMANAYRGEDFLDKAIDNLDELYDDNGQRKSRW